MLCPTCKNTFLTIKNDSYYCPSCKLFIGPATEDFTHQLSSEFIASQPKIREQKIEQSTDANIMLSALFISACWVLAHYLIFDVFYHFVLLYSLTASKEVGQVFSILQQVLALPQQIIITIGFLLFGQEQMAALLVFSFKSLVMLILSCLLLTWFLYALSFIIRYFSAINFLAFHTRNPTKHERRTIRLLYLRLLSAMCFVMVILVLGINSYREEILSFVKSFF